MTESHDRFCVYTALFGDYDELRAPLYMPPGVDFICFSDRERNASGWDVRIIDLPFDDPFTKNRALKIRPHEYLKDYDCSLYIDANLAFLADPLLAYQTWLKGTPFAAWRHPTHACIYEELELILEALRHEPDAIVDQYEFLRAQAVPARTGLIEASFLWRDHRDGAVRCLMEQWWEHFLSFKSRRDQPPLAYLMWKTGTRPAQLPELWQKWQQRNLL